MQKLVDNVVPEKQLREAQLRALKLMADTVGHTYGPMGGYSAYSRSTSSKSQTSVVCNYSKDGFTVLKNIQVDKPIEAMIREEIITICTQVIKTVGDGTTSATILAYNIFNSLLDLQNKGFPKRKIIKVFKELIKEASKEIESKAHKCTLDDIYNIAFTSLNGNEEMAKTIRDIYDKNGFDTFIDVSASNTPDTVIKVYGGMDYNCGYIDPCFINDPTTNSCVLNNPHVYLFHSPIDTPEMIDILKMIYIVEVDAPYRKINAEYQKTQNPNKIKTPWPNDILIICPFITRDANSYIDSLVTNFTNTPVEQRAKFCIVSGFKDENDIIDIKELTGGKTIKKYIDPEEKKRDEKEGLFPTAMNIKTFAGTTEKAVIDSTSMKIINPSKKYDEKGELSTFFNQYIDSLKAELAKYEETNQEVVLIGKLKRRINRLCGNMVDLFVGGIGTTDRMALSDSVEDAVLNCRSAAQDGVGYGANYEGLRVFNSMSSKYEEELKKVEDNKNASEDELLIAKIKAEVSDALLRSYVRLVELIYLPYTDDNEKDALKIVALSLANEDENLRKPFNIISEDFDDKVLTSIKTEPAILDSISRIMSILYDTNQFLLPSPQFNIYTMGDDKISVNNTKQVENVTEPEVVEQKPESVPVSELINKD